MPVKLEVGEDGVTTEPPVPLTIVQAPVPDAGAVAAKAVDVTPQSPSWSGPALAVGAALNFMSTSSELGGQLAEVMLQRRV